jgi:sugar lactone lactonase YvrE
MPDTILAPAKRYEAECVLPIAATLGEGPLWDAPSGTLYFVDIKGCTLHAFHPARQACSSYYLPDYVCWLVPQRDGDGFMAGLRRGLARVWFEPEWRVETLDVGLDLAPGVRLNDAKVHPDGSLWFGSMHNTEPECPLGRLFRLTPDLRLSEQASEIHICNGPAFSLDGTRMYHNDSLLGRTYAYPIENGKLGPADLWRVCAPEQGSPDGMCIDSEGGLWIAHWGAGCVRRLLPDGRCDSVVHVPVSQVSSVALGGPDLRTLYITTAAEALDGREPLAGGLFAARVDVAGRLPAAFG